MTSLILGGEGGQRKWQKVTEGGGVGKSDGKWRFFLSTKNFQILLFDVSWAGVFNIIFFYILILLKNLLPRRRRQKKEPETL